MCLQIPHANLSSGDDDPDMGDDGYGENGNALKKQRFRGNTTHRAADRDDHNSSGSGPQFSKRADGATEAACNEDKAACARSGKDAAGAAAPGSSFINNGRKNLDKTDGLNKCRT